MTVAVDVVGTLNVRTGTGSPTTWTHAGGASGVRGVVIMICNGSSATDNVSAVSYGGVACTRMQRNTDTAGEPGSSEIWFLGSGVPQGSQTVSYTTGATTDDYAVQVVTLTGSNDIWEVTSNGVNENATNPSVTLSVGGKNVMCFACIYSGLAAPTSITAGTGCTLIGSGNDFGNNACHFERQTTAGTSNFTIGFTAAVDDVAFSAAAFTDAPADFTITDTTVVTSEVYSANFDFKMSTDNLTLSENYSTFLYTPNFVLTLRNTKGSPLTPTEMDDNFANLAKYKLENSMNRATGSGTLSPSLAYSQRQYTLTSGPIVIGAITGTPVDGQTFSLILFDNGTQRTITSWDTSYRVCCDTTLPTVTTTGKVMTFGFIYNNADSKWDLIGYAEG